MIMFLSWWNLLQSIFLRSLSYGFLSLGPCHGNNWGYERTWRSRLEGARLKHLHQAIFVLITGGTAVKFHNGDRMRVLNLNLFFLISGVSFDTCVWESSVEYPHEK